MGRIVNGNGSNDEEPTDRASEASPDERPSPSEELPPSEDQTPTEAAGSVPRQSSTPSAAWGAPAARPSGGPSPLKRIAGFKFNSPVWALAVAALVALFIGLGIGTAASSGDIDRLKDDKTALEEENDALEEEVADRGARREADEAELERIEAEEEASERKTQQRQEEEQARQQAEAEAEAQRQQAAAEAEAAQQQAAADAEAAATAETERRRNTVEGGGTYAIGPDINAGQWRTPGPDLTGLCYYAILNSPDTFDIATNNLSEGPSIAQLPEGAYFETSGCQPWTRSG